MKRIETAQQRNAIIKRQVSKLFKLFMRTLKQNFIYKAKFLKTYLYWIIDNSKDVQDKIKFINSNSKATTISSYDFIQLYTNIPCNLLIDQMKFVSDEVFKIKSDMKFLKVTATKALWFSNNSSTVKVGTLVLYVSQGVFHETFT